MGDSAAQGKGSRDLIIASITGAVALISSVVTAAVTRGASSEDSATKVAVQKIQGAFALYATDVDTASKLKVQELQNAANRIANSAANQIAGKKNQNDFSIAQ